MKIKIKQSEIWLADLNPRIGTEPGKIRPVVIIQTNLLNGIHPSTLICPVTSKIFPEASLLRVHMSQVFDEIKEPGDIMIDQIRAIDNRRLLRKTGQLKPDQIRKLKENLKIVMDL
jgi:mRNA interferase MazF